MIGLASIILLGFFLGMRHATDADHVIAVSTIISRQKSVVRAALTGAVWGVGHTLTIFVVGAAIILFGWAIPPRLGLGMELSVGLMLVLLGLWNIRAFLRRLPQAFRPGAEVTDNWHLHLHGHDGHGENDHSHETTPSYAGDPSVERLQNAPLSRLDRLLGKLAVYQFVRPLLVGIVHGLAGSAAVTLLILAAIRDPRWAIAYLLVFGAGTIAGMMLITFSIASAFHFVGRKQRGFSHALGLTCSVISLAFGIYLTYQIGFLGGLFTSHPNWIPH